MCCACGPSERLDAPSICFCMSEVISSFRSLRAGSQVFALLMLFLGVILHTMSSGKIQIQNPFLTAQSTQMKSVISVPIKYFIHHYPRALFNDIPRVGAHFYDIPGSGRTFTTYPGRGAV